MRENGKNQKVYTDVKRIILIVLICIMIIACILLAYGAISETSIVKHKVTTGSVTLQTLNLQVEDRATGTFGTSIPGWAPGDANIVRWDTVNTGTAAARTRHTIQVYWNEDIGTTENTLLYLYPANMSNSEVQEDFSGERKYAIDVNDSSIIETDDGGKVGIAYTFYGDTLDGTEKTGKATEVTYDETDFETDVYTTAENDKLTDKVAFRVLLNPNTSYIFQEKTLKIRIVTEALQYTDNGVEDWQVTSVQEIQ